MSKNDIGLEEIIYQINKVGENIKLNQNPEATLLQVPEYISKDYIEKVLKKEVSLIGNSFGFKTYAVKK